MFSRFDTIPECLGQARIQKCGLCGSTSRVPKAKAPKAPTGVRSPRKILACSPLKWCILMHSGTRFRPNIISTMMFTTSRRGLIKIMKITVCAMRIISTLKPAKINGHGHSAKRNFCKTFRGEPPPTPMNAGLVSGRRTDRQTGYIRRARKIINL